MTTIFEKWQNLDINNLECIRALNKENMELKQAMEWFCQRVEAGEVRSKKTYARFRELLDRER